MTRLYKRGDIFYIDYTDRQGNRHRKSTGTTNKRLAEEQLAKEKAAALDRKAGIETPEKVTLSEFATEFLSFCKANKKPNTVVFYDVTLKALVRTFGDYLLDEIKPYFIEQYKLKRARDVSKTTVKREMTTLHRVFNLAILWKKAVDNPVKLVDKIKEPEARTRSLSEEELRRLVAECGPPYLRMAVLIALNTGLRKGEILALGKDDVDLEAGIISVSSTMCATGLGTPKSGKGRQVPINSTLLPELAKWVEGLKEEHLFPHGDFKKAFNAAVRRAGIKDFHFHDLRHTFASRLIMAGADIATLKELLGHATLSMAMKYAHPSKEHKRMALDKIGELFSTEKNALMGNGF
ncbi:MAG: tyrosine-type recombinase/integrase [Candidatus Eremiobacteraeota bacterium]|nr:tyrosine-type recombinase/integrase [Candidatus Eremiobacteraeota bacterium]